MYSNVLIVNLYQWVLIPSFNAEQYPVEMFASVPPTSQISSSSPVAGSVLTAMVMVPCPKSPATDSGRGSWSAIHLHLSSCDGSADLTPDGGSRGGCGGTSSQSSFGSSHEVDLAAVKSFLLAALWAMYSSQGITLLGQLLTL